MRRWTRTLVAVTAVAIATGAAVPANAHTDGTPDAAGSSCDTVVRPGHEPGHHHTYPPNDREVGPVYVHNHGGHYAVTTDHGYIEVIGGQGYNENGNQGGWIQGEIDPGAGADVDFRGGIFTGTNPPYRSGAVCVSAADNRQYIPVP